MPSALCSCSHWVPLIDRPLTCSLPASSSTTCSSKCLSWILGPRLCKLRSQTMHSTSSPGHHVQSIISFEKLPQKLTSSGGRLDLMESDLRPVHDEGAERYAQLHPEL